VVCDHLVEPLSVLVALRHSQAATAASVDIACCMDTWVAANRTLRHPVPLECLRYINMCICCKAVTLCSDVMLVTNMLCCSLLFEVLWHVTLWAPSRVLWGYNRHGLLRNHCMTHVDCLVLLTLGGEVLHMLGVVEPCGGCGGQAKLRAAQQPLLLVNVELTEAALLLLLLLLRCLLL
jgi:hypothetical protein